MFKNYDALHMTLLTRLPLLSCAYVEKIGEPGYEAIDSLCHLLRHQNLETW